MMNGAHIPFGPGLSGINGIEDLPPMDGGGGFNDIEQFRKAVTAGYGTDVAALTGGGALRLQSIETTLLRTVQEDEHFVFFNKLVQSNAGATVDEYTTKPRIGGYPGSGFNSELGDIQQTQGTYKREVGLVKYLMTMREVSVVQQAQKTIVDAITEEKIDAARELKTSVEHACFYGDSAVNSLEFDGLFKTILTENVSGLIKDARGKGLSYVAREIIDIAAAMASYGNFGRATDYFCSLDVQGQEIDQKVDPAFRVGPNGETGLKVGTPVAGIRTSNGVIKSNQDVFIQEGQAPWESRVGFLDFVGIAGGPLAPTTVAGVAGANAASQFLAEHAGLYYYAVESINQKGRSVVTKSTQVTVAAGDRVVVTITHPADPTITSFAIYRSKKNGVNTTSELREMVGRVARSGGATSIYNDDNQNVPGSSQLFLVNMAPGAKAVELRRLLPMTMFPLYPTSKATKPWAQLFFCYLRMAKRKHIAMVKNIVPDGAAWKPF